jgi:hypothetical protein
MAPGNDDGTRPPDGLTVVAVLALVADCDPLGLVLLLELAAVVLPLLEFGALGALLLLLDDELDPASPPFVLAEGSGEEPLARLTATIPAAIASPGITLDSSASGAKRGRLGDFKTRRRTRRRRPSGWNRSKELRSRWRTVRRKLCPTRPRPRNQDGCRRNAVNQL